MFEVLREKEEAHWPELHTALYFRLITTRS